MCRSELPSGILARLDEEKKQWELRYLIHKLKCANCGKKNLKGNQIQKLF